MNLLNHNTTKPVFLVASILVFVILLFSCEVDEVQSIDAKSTFEIPSSINLDDTLKLSAKTISVADVFEWQISDGATYYEANAHHTFSKPGNYTINLVTSSGNNTSVITQNIEVTSSYVLLSSTAPIYAQKVFYTDNQIVVSALKLINSEKKEFQPAFFVLNNSLEIISEIDDPLELKSIKTLNDSVIYLDKSINIDGASYFQYKSVENIISNTSSENTILDYNDGYLYVRNEGYLGFYIDYYNESNLMLWTKMFQEENKKNARFVFNLNNRLFYLSFDKETDDLYIEKFKNPSVRFDTRIYPIGIKASNREELFAFSNSYSNSINFGVYNIDEDVSTVYMLNESCELNSINSFNGRLNGIHLAALSNGSNFIKQENNLLKFDINWELVSEKEFNNSNFNMCKLGDNLFLVSENLPSGKIKLSYLDKHLNQVSLN